jgi:hypothetical protein
MIRIVAALLCWSFVSLGSETVVKMRLHRDSVSSSFDRELTEVNFLDISTIEQRFHEVLTQQFSFCSQKIERLNEYFLREEGLSDDYDITSIRRRCLKDIRKWHLNMEKKFYKYKRVFLKSTLKKNLEILKKSEEDEIKAIISKYNKLKG